MSDLTLRSSEFLKNGENITVRKDITASGWGRHNHEFIEFAYVASGSGRHVIDGVSDFIKKGDLFLFNTNVSHEFSVEGEEPVVMLNCLFLPTAVDSSFADCGDFVDVAYHYLLSTIESDNDPKHYIKLTGGRTGKAEMILEDMLEEYESKEYGYKQVLEAQLTRLLILAFRLYRDNTERNGSSHVLRKIVVDSAVRFMTSQYALPITSKLLAERSYVSTSYFNKIFRDETGTSAFRMLQEIRLRRSCELLKDTALTAAQIGNDVGYTDTKHFYRIFKERYGMTPGEYRDKCHIESK